MQKLELCCEISANHLGSFARACQLVQAAADTGADLVKFQLWSKDKRTGLNTMCVDRGYTLTHGPWAGRKLAELYDECYTPWDWIPTLFRIARELGMKPFGAGFDSKAVDFLDAMEVDRHKIASFELVDLPLIRHAARKGKPLILSTGMASRDEVIQAIQAADEALTAVNNCADLNITLLKCTSAYPAAAKDANLAAMMDMNPISHNLAQMTISAGLSDHSLGIGVAVAAAALGATYIEKHLTMSRADGGPDAGFSMEPHEFKAMVTACREAQAAIGEVKYGGESTELRRSWYAIQDIQPGEELFIGVNVRTARPALGLFPSIDLNGKKATKFHAANTPLLHIE